MPLPTWWRVVAKERKSTAEHLPVERHLPDVADAPAAGAIGCAIGMAALHAQQRSAACRSRHTLTSAVVLWLAFVNVRGAEVTFCCRPISPCATLPLESILGARGFVPGTVGRRQRPRIRGPTNYSARLEI